MIEFTLALVTFLVAHLIPASPGVRARLVAAMGRGVYLTAYSVLSLVMLTWLVLAAQRADTIPLWNPAPWQWLIALVLMPLASFFLLAGLLAPNPLSITFRGGTEPGAIVAITRHPVLWGFLIWALAHIPPNGDVVSLVLFGGMAALSLLGFVLLDAKARRRLGPGSWVRLSGPTSIVPFATWSSRRARPSVDGSLLFAGAASAAFYLWFVIQGHSLLIGRDPLALLAVG